MMTQTFKYFTTDKAPIHLPGMPFFLGALCMALAFLVIMNVFGKERRLKIANKYKPEQHES
jgi:DHA1 family tetracycline resistance protein-like MFS transporter